MNAKEADLSMASCGYPYYVGGVFDDRNLLVATPAGIVRDPAFFQKAKGIEALVGTEATAIDRAARTVRCRHLPSGATRTLPYGRLVIATGARTLSPPVPGLELEGVRTLHSLARSSTMASASRASATPRPACAASPISRP